MNAEWTAKFADVSKLIDAADGHVEMTPDGGIRFKYLSESQIAVMLRMIGFNRMLRRDDLKLFVIDIKHVCGCVLFIGDKSAVVNAEMNSRAAIRYAMDRVPNDGALSNVIARNMLSDILAQCGCDDVNPHGDGSLTDYMDTIIFG